MTCLTAIYHSQIKIIKAGASWQVTKVNGTQMSKNLVVDEKHVMVDLRESLLKIKTMMSFQ
jgi:hypothetical protein